MKNILFLSSLAILCGCSAGAVLVDEPVDYNPQKNARIRVFLTNGNLNVRPYEDLNCEQWKENPKEYGGIKFYNGLPRKTLRNFSIGIPLTPKASKALNRSSLTETVSFKEMLVTAGQPMVVRGGLFYHDTAKVIKGYSCDIVGEFTPEAGVDYEVGYRQNSKYCFLVINKINANDNSTTATLGEKVNYRKCN